MQTCHIHVVGCADEFDRGGGGGGFRHSGRDLDMSLWECCIRTEVVKAWERGVSTGQLHDLPLATLQGPFVKLNDLMHIIETCTLPESFAPGNVIFIPHTSWQPLTQNTQYKQAQTPLSLSEDLHADCGSLLSLYVTTNG